MCLILHTSLSAHVSYSCTVILGSYLLLWYCTAVNARPRGHKETTAAGYSRRTRAPPIVGPHRGRIGARPRNTLALIPLMAFAAAARTSTGSSRRGGARSTPRPQQTQQRTPFSVSPVTATGHSSRRQQNLARWASNGDIVTWSAHAEHTMPCTPARRTPLSSHHSSADSPGAKERRKASQYDGWAGAPSSQLNESTKRFHAGSRRVLRASCLGTPVGEGLASDGLMVDRLRGSPPSQLASSPRAQSAGLASLLSGGGTAAERPDSAPAARVLHLRHGPPAHVPLGTYDPTLRRWGT